MKAAVFDGGSQERYYGRVRNFTGALSGRHPVTAFLTSVAAQSPEGVEFRHQDLSGQPALVVERDGQLEAAILLSLSGGKITQIFIQANRQRLRHL